MYHNYPRSPVPTPAVRPPSVKAVIVPNIKPSPDGNIIKPSVHQTTIKSTDGGGVRLGIYIFPNILFVNDALRPDVMFLLTKSTISSLSPKVAPMMRII
jgi:hypothetical protein